MTERIESAAIFSHGTIYALPPPARHHTILNTNSVIVDGIVTSRILDGVQGFVTSTGRFVNRYEAWELASAANQIIEQPDGGRRLGPQLFSEDLW